MRSQRTRKVVDKILATTPIFILSATYCPYCSEAKRVLKKMGLKYKSIEFDVEPHGKEIADEIERRTKEDGVPAIFIDGEFIGGLEELYEWAADS